MLGNDFKVGEDEGETEMLQMMEAGMMVIVPDRSLLYSFIFFLRFFLHSVGVRARCYCPDSAGLDLLT